ncbi:MAG: MarR family winged helix-turn-helix transcriptional regulator [Steroidobacteraceae bacterium]
MPPAPSLALDRFVPYRLSVLSNLISTAIAGAYVERFGLSIPEWRVVAALGERAGMSAAEVAARTAMDKVAVSRAVAALQRAGRIVRATSTRDRRRSALRLSRAGATVYAKVAPYALAYEAALLASLDLRERDALERLLDKLTRRAVELRPHV